MVWVWRSPTTMSASPRDDRADQGRDVAAVVLVIGVGVDDDVCARVDGGVQPLGEGGGETAVAVEADDVADAELAGDFGGAIGAAIVDHQELNGSDARDLAGEGGDGLGKRLLLVVARYLDDKIHGERRVRGIGVATGICSLVSGLKSRNTNCFGEILRRRGFFLLMGRGRLPPVGSAGLDPSHNSPLSVS